MIYLTGTTFNLFNQGSFFYKYQNYFFFKLDHKTGFCSAVVLKKTIDFLNLISTKSCQSAQQVYKHRINIQFYFLFFWKRLTFRGKSYRIRYYTRLKKFTFNFNFSHWAKVKMYTPWGVSRRKKKKERDRQRYIIYTYNTSLAAVFDREFQKIRRYNWYTMRGLRFKAQPIIKRPGKASQHISILH